MLGAGWLAVHAVQHVCWSLVAACTMDACLSVCPRQQAHHRGGAENVRLSNRLYPHSTTCTAKTHAYSGMHAHAHAGVVLLLLLLCCSFALPSSATPPI